MKIWPVQDAKARFSELLETCVSEGPQKVSKRGAVTAVLVPIAEWERLQPKRATLKELLLSDDYYRGEMDIPPRGQHKHRAPVEF
jgi:prevent-host-death family protein